MEELEKDVKEEAVGETKCCVWGNKLKQCVCSNREKYIAGIIILIIIAGIGIYAKKTNYNTFKKWFVKNITQEEAKAKIEKLIGEDNAGVKVKAVAEESGLYKITIGIEGQPDQYAFVTKDGTKFIQQAISFAEIEKQQEDQKKAEEEAARPIEKTDKPQVDLFVMSFCPYGNKAEDTILPVYNLLKNKVDFNFHYIVNSSGDEIQSLHGEKEVIQDKIEVCVLKDYGKDRWMNFVAYVNKNCGSDGACWEAGAKILKIDAVKIKTCVDADGVALLKKDEQISSEAGAKGSPTMKINGVSSKVVYQYGNSEAYKQAICDAFSKVPAECGKKLSAQATTAQGGSCGS